MNARLWIPAAALWLAAGACGAAPVLIDHRNVDVAQLTQAQIERAKASLHIAYGHTSHGSQLTDGMSGLVGFANGGGKGLALPADAFAWNNGGSGGALDLHDYAMGGDVGYYPQWYDNTVTYLNDPSHADVNVILWSWCGQMDDEYAAGTLSNYYLLPMTSLETSYPDVVFIYMTGHAPGPDEMNPYIDRQTKEACQCIRDYCMANNKVLFDFNDIEHYNPDGAFFECVSDSCNYYATNGGAAAGNWATEWQDAHVQDVDWYDCSSAHSQPLNANLKAYAAWALWCRLGADLDRDEIADEWEERYGGTGRFGGGTNDFDGDGTTDWEEFVLDASPTSSNAPFKIAGLVATNVPAMEIATSTARTYSLKACDDLVAGGWTSVTSRPGTGAAMGLADETDFAGFRAYRVGVSVP
ncbi:MAG: hypothetical protein AB7V14_07670 [Kiritimatiellia bacterium]